jgi:hypothetical protein
MNRYHKKVYIPDKDKKRLETLTVRLNALKWTYTVHCLDNLKYRTIRQADILLFIKNTVLQSKNIFEYYTDEKNDIIKICYRLQYTSGIDLILILSEVKNIITIYTNNTEDNHITLNKKLYTQKEV